ncbi:MAG: T9SS type A sorting domain-containing protein, partial [Cyclobacteriaceae bacterium]|nr:T9SS type A sorting domain-containing protein [Cyclobacteriaceae bacterium]
HVTGDLGSATNNGVKYVVLLATDAIIVDGTLYGKNNNAFSGSGSISGGTLDVKNGSTCSSPCPVTGGFTNCFDNGGTFCTDYGVLPVTLMSFSGRAEKNSILLNWATSSELNFDFFEVERSPNGKDFISIGKVNGHGTSNLRHDYELKDQLPLIGWNYYRLKSVDFDGYTEYFNVIAVDFSGDKMFSVYPNPSDGGTVGYLLNFSPDENTFIEVYNSLGINLGFSALSQTQGIISFTNPLNSGLYYARINAKNFTKVEKFIVR